MIDCATLDRHLLNAGVSFFTGVPDSCIKPWIDYLLDKRPNDHVIATNEGEALAIAAGYHLATGKPAGVYLQNAGFGNLVNPLSSVVDEFVYKIPILLIISWRGKPGVKDEPQHRRMGENMEPILRTFGVQYSIFDMESLRSIMEAATKSLNAGHPYALLLRKGNLEPYSILKRPSDGAGLLSRSEAIQLISDHFGRNAVYFATTGKTSRELYVLRDISHDDHSRDFLNVGGMGFVSSLALGFALRSDKRTIVLDGDGSVLMHLGNLATIGHYRPPNIIHFILDNNSHDSVGGLATVSETVDFARIAEGAGYRRALTVASSNELNCALTEVTGQQGPTLIRVKVRKGASPDMPRPSMSPQDRKTLLMARFSSSHSSS